MEIDKLVLLEIEKAKLRLDNEHFDSLWLVYNIKTEKGEVLITEFISYPLKNGKKAIDIIEYCIDDFFGNGHLRENEKSSLLIEILSDATPEAKLFSAEINIEIIVKNKINSIKMFN